MLFYLGTHRPNWLAESDIPMFLSRRVLRGRKSFQRALGRWALDSGGFSELSEHGEWTISPEQYADEIAEWSSQIGGLDWAAPQDWMCEPHMIKNTGLSILEHQKRTIESVARLRAIVKGTPIVPVLQGWTEADYIAHVAMYRSEGFNLEDEPVVAIGSVCRRQHTKEAESIIRSVSSMGINLHGLGFKITGLRAVADVIYSADSMAWSSRARFARAPMFPECSGHKNCANCKRWALAWREKVVNG